MPEHGKPSHGVLEITLPWLDNVTRAEPSRQLPVVLTPTEMRAVLERMDGVYALMARLSTARACA